RSKPIERKLFFCHSLGLSSVSASEQPDRLTYSVHALDPPVLSRSAVGKKLYPASVMSDGA
ncbi:MAG: hypothetical protein ACO3UV_04255, partial [Pseudomonadales bacterium]